jgi:ADP-ribosylation factor-like protein 2
MGLLTILKKVKQRERELRLLILGLDNAGKTTIMKKISGEDIHEISPTVGFNIKSLEYKGNETKKLHRHVYCFERNEFN